MRTCITLFLICIISLTANGQLAQIDFGLKLGTAKDDISGTSYPLPTSRGLGTGIYWEFWSGSLVGLLIMKDKTKGFYAGDYLGLDLTTGYQKKKIGNLAEGDGFLEFKIDMGFQAGYRIDTNKSFGARWYYCGAYSSLRGTPGNSRSSQVHDDLLNVGIFGSIGGIGARVDYGYSGYNELTKNGRRLALALFALKRKKFSFIPNVIKYDRYYNYSPVITSTERYGRGNNHAIMLVWGGIKF